ncbi:hypothetical protein GUJ93_ZPchr0001g29368 [Zizania palustris]|uniref:Uncharacterized protein n=1 Tax=Zizania palustris TaxID=103762 RepID=A0A8J5RQ81_ZIZPA|nr:hypothetical protein GUJ93_ZPchr0001g29368 [Zizania palustris]
MEEGSVAGRAEEGASDRHLRARLKWVAAVDIGAHGHDVIVVARYVFVADARSPSSVCVAVAPSSWAPLPPPTCHRW